MHSETFFSSCSPGSWIMFPGMLLHWATLIIYARHMMHVGPITIAYFRQWYNNVLCCISALDAESERQVQDALDRIIKGQFALSGCSLSTSSTDSLNAVSFVIITHTQLSTTSCHTRLVIALIMRFLNTHSSQPHHVILGL